MSSLLIDINGKYEKILLDNSQPFEVSFKATEFENQGRISNSISKTFTIIATNENNKVLLNLGSNNSKNGALRNKVVDAIYENKGTQRKGKIQITNESHNGNYSRYECLFFEGATDWVTIANNAKIRDFDLGTTVYDKATVESIFQNDLPFDGTSNVWYSVKEYGGAFGVIGLDRTTTKNIVPDVYAKSIFEAWEQFSGWTFKSEFIRITIL